MAANLVKLEEWVSLKKQREIPLLIHIRTEVLERLLFFEGFFTNDEKDSKEALKKMDLSIRNGSFKFTNVLLDDYDTISTNEIYVTRRVL